MKKSGKGLELVKEEIALGAVGNVADAAGQAQKEEALIALGGIKAISRLVENLSSQTIRALDLFGESKGYEALGFETFADFLNSDLSPMTKNQFYDRRNALAAEGDATYDLLTSMGVPISRRKLLAEGTVHLDGETLIVGEQRVPVTDRRRVVEVIRSLAEDNRRKAEKIEKGEAKNRKLKHERDELKQRPATGALDEFDQTLIRLLGELKNLALLGFELPDPERIAKRGYTFERIAEARLELEEALGVQAPNFSGNGNGNGELSDDDVSELGEEM